MTYAREAADIATDPGASYWLRQAVADLTARDPLDALRDVEVLLDLQRVRWAECESATSIIAKEGK